MARGARGGRGLRLLLDEMLSHRIARELRLRGHDVEAVNGHPDWQAYSDREVFELARREGRAIVTNNVRDYRPLHHEAVQPGGRGHWGLILMPSRYRRTRAEIGRLVAALEAKLADHPGDRDLADTEAWLSLRG